MKNDDTISTLNNLIETCKDGEEGCLTCAEDIGDPKLKLFLPSAHKAVLPQRANCRSKLSPMAAILNECKRGADVAVRSYRRAMEKDLPSEIAAMVKRQYQGALQNHDQAKLFRDDARARSST